MESRISMPATNVSQINPPKPFREQEDDQLLSPSTLVVSEDNCRPSESTRVFLSSAATHGGMFLMGGGTIGIGALIWTFFMHCNPLPSDYSHNLQPPSNHTQFVCDIEAIKREFSLLAAPFGMLLGLFLFLGAFLGPHCYQHCFNANHPQKFSPQELL
jgi:hypothetical protein